MSAATAQPCVVCQVSSSKYKCPTCRSATCSLACSKQHAAQGHLSLDHQRSDTSRSQSIIKDATLPSLHLGNETIEAPQAHRFSKVDKYVGLNEYDSKQLMEDFEYLQYLGKCVTMLGKDITKNGWIKDEAPKQNNSQHSGGAGRGPPNRNTNGFHQHVSAEGKSRHTFESWIRKLRLPIMLVPDGMSLRKENQTRWKNNTKQLLCTVEIRIPTASSSSSKTRSILHHITWDKQVAEVVVKEMERKAKEKGKEISTDVADLIEGVTLHKWRDTLCIALSVSNERLRNESSSKFLEWWQRQVKNGMVKADGLEFDEAKKGELEQLRNGAWAAIEGMESSEAWPAADESAEQAQLSAEVEKSSGGLISSVLLDKMQTARSSKVQLDAQRQGGSHSEKGEAAAPGTRRSLVILEGKETLQEILQSLTKGLAIVEYFHLEVWPRKALSEQIKMGNVVRERLEGETEDEVDLERDYRKRGQDEEGSAAASQMKKAKTVASSSSSNALGSLNAYASSDEDDEEDEGKSQHSDELEMTDAGPVYAGGLAEMARSLGMVPS